MIRTFPEFIFATGGLPLLPVGDQRLLAGPFDVSATITDNAVVNANLLDQSKWDKRVQGMYGSTSGVPPKGILHFHGFQILIVGTGYRVETDTIKTSLETGLYIHTVRASNVLDLPCQTHISELWSQFQQTQTAAATQSFVLQQGRPWIYERPLRFDLETDQMALKLDSAVDFATGNMAALVRLFGHIAPKGYAGSIGSDGDACGNGGAQLTSGGRDGLAIWDGINFAKGRSALGVPSQVRPLSFVGSLG